MTPEQVDLIVQAIHESAVGLAVVYLFCTFLRMMFD